MWLRYNGFFYKHDLGLNENERSGGLAHIFVDEGNNIIIKYCMKKYFYLIIVLMMVSCTDQFMVEDVAGEYAEQTPVNEVATLMEKARWGDGQAFLKLADCYRDGNEVEKDFVGMLCMVSQADEFGSIGRMEDYLKEIPENSDFRTIFDAIEKSSTYACELTESWLRPSGKTHHLRFEVTDNRQNTGVFEATFAY